MEIERSSVGQRVTGHPFTVVLNYNDKDLVIHLARDSEGFIHMGLVDLLNLVGVGESLVDDYICRNHLYEYIGSIQNTKYNDKHEVVITSTRSLPMTFAIDFMNDLTEDPDVTDEQAFRARDFIAQMAVYYFSTVYHQGLEIYEVA